MLRIASRYARLLQARFHTTGHLFERRYHAVLVDADEYLLELLRYIHLNPVRAQMVGSPDEYPWSSHGAYLGGQPEPWLTTDFALAMFDANRDQARQAYRRFVEGEVGQHTVSPLQHCNANDPRILGSDTFVANLLGEAWRPKSQTTLDDLLADACLKFQITREVLTSTSRHRATTRARAWVAHQALTLRITSLAQVARAFGRDESSLRKSINVHFNIP
jgi:hypothetical protein